MNVSLRRGKEGLSGEIGGVLTRVSRSLQEMRDPEVKCC